MQFTTSLKGQQSSSPNASHFLNHFCHFIQNWNLIFQGKAISMTSLSLVGVRDSNIHNVKPVICLKYKKLHSIKTYSYSYDF